MQVRSEFEQVVVDDLYGHAGDPDQQLDTAPQDRYLAGMLAPQRSIAEPGEDAGTADPAGSDDAGLPDELAKPMLFPASKGMSFAVPTGTGWVVVEAA